MKPPPTSEFRFILAVGTRKCFLGLAAMDGGIGGITDPGDAAELEHVRKRREHTLCLSVRWIPFRSGAGVPGSSANWFRAADRNRCIHGFRDRAAVFCRRRADSAVCKAASTDFFLGGLSYLARCTQEIQNCRRIC